MRGLPHAHITIRFQGPQPVTADHVDACISAEMPDASSPDSETRLYARLVRQFMMHHCRGKCAKPDGGCKYRYPYQQTTTTTFDTFGYARPKRPGTPGNPSRDVRVVPHNKKLLLKYRCHINVEVAGSVYVMAYLYKYIYKGPDLAYFRFRQPGD